MIKFDNGQRVQVAARGNNPSLFATVINAIIIGNQRLYELDSPFIRTLVAERFLRATQASKDS